MKKKLILVVYIIIAFAVLSTNVYAALTLNISMTSDKTKVKAGEDVIVSVTLSNISSGVSSVKGYIDVDENVLSAPSENMIVKNSNGRIEVTSGGSVTNNLSYVYAPTTPIDADVVFNTSASATDGHDIYFTEDFNPEIKNDSVILKLKFTVKEGTANGNLTNAVKIEGLTAESTTMANGTGTTEKLENLSANITIVVDNTAEPSNQEEPSDPGQQEDPEQPENPSTEDDDAKKAEEERKAAEEAAKKAEEERKAAEEAAKKAEEARKAEETRKAQEAANANKNTNTNTNTNTNKSTTTGSTSNNNLVNNANTTKDNTVAASRIPATGAKSIIIPALVLIVLGLISYKKYVDYKEF